MSSYRWVETPDSARTHTSIWVAGLESSATQLSTSACGPTALLDVLRALGFTDVAPEKVLETVPARLRNYNTEDLEEYLLSRVVAGTTHADLIYGVETLSHGQATGRLFAPHPLTPPGVLAHQLGRWIECGAVPMLTLNLFLEGQDAWHHQVVRGVSLPAAPQSAPPPTQLAQQPLDPTTQKRTAEGTPEGGVPNNTGNTGPPIGTTQHHQQQQQPQGCAHHPYQGLQQTGKAEEALLHLGNPRVDELMSHILPRVTSTPFMVIPRDHVERRVLALAASQGVGVVLDLHKRLQRSPLWGQHSVGEQVLQIFSDMLAGGRGGEGGCCRESSEEEEEQQEEKGGTACLEEGADNEQESALREGAATDPVMGPQRRPGGKPGQKHRGQLSPYLGHTRFGDLVIPWGGLAGITLFACVGSSAHAAILSRPTSSVPLPAYSTTTCVCTDLTPP